MDIVLVSVAVSAVIILVAIFIGFKKVIDVNHLLIKKQEETDKKLLEFVENELDNGFKSSNEELKNVAVSIKSSLDENIDAVSKRISTLSDTVTESIKTESQMLKKSLEASLEKHSNTTDTKINEVLKIQDKNMINLKSKLENNFYNVVKLVHNLRLDNLINVSNEISKYKEGVYEDEHFLQEVGHCKIIKLTDKNSGEITNVYYDENGNKSYTETLSNDKLKYKMQYENGKLSNGAELNNDGDIVFEYFYDDAEEVNRKIEYIYDENANLKDKQETIY